MKGRLLLIALAAVLISACNTGRKKITQNIDYFAPAPQQEATYEFTSYDIPALSPSVTAYMEQSQTQETEVSADEDFTAESVSSMYGLYGDVVVKVSTHKFKLGASATRHEMTLFQQALEKSYMDTLQEYHPAGFTYAMSSIGSVNPLSEIEVTCKMSELAANQEGQAACNMFFKNISSEFIRLMRAER
jgi:hypothetical protein